MSWHKAHETRPMKQGTDMKGPPGCISGSLVTSNQIAFAAWVVYPWAISPLVKPELWTRPCPSSSPPIRWVVRARVSHKPGRWAQPSLHTVACKIASSFYLVLKRQVWCSLLNLSISINTSNGGIVRFYSQEINPAFASQSVLWLQRLYNLLAKQSVQLRVDLYLLPAWEL